MKLIQSRENPYFKELLKLTGTARIRNKVGQTVLDGAHLLAAYLDAGHVPLHILLNQSATHNVEINDLLARVAQVPVTQLDDKLFDELTELKTPTGLLAQISIPVMQPKQMHFGMLLEDVQDPGNLGSMLRSAAAAGCDAVYLSNACADAWSPKVLRAAMGGHFVLDIHSHQDLTQVAQSYTGRLYATSLQASESLYQTDLRGDIAFMVGNEGAGLSPQLQHLATHQITIPMPGNVESLNAAAASAICLFEAVRQRQAQ